MKRIHFATTLLLLALLAPAAALTAQGGPARPDMPAAAPGGLLFIGNAGQFDPAARFQVWGGGQTLWLAEDALWLTIVQPGDRSQGTGVRGQGSGDWEQGAERFSVAPDDQSAARGSVPQKAVNLRLSFPGANPQPVLEPFDRLGTHVSYFIGNDPAKWRADVPVWGGVRYRELYPASTWSSPARAGGSSGGSWHRPQGLAQRPKGVQSRGWTGVRASSCALRARTRWRWTALVCA